MGRVEKRFPGETVVCLGSGPSLTQADVDFCRGKARLIAVNSSIQLAPDADVLYACDGAWWTHHPETRDFGGLKFALQALTDRPDVVRLRDSGCDGLELDPQFLRTGKNSGYQAIGVAVHLGATRIALLGYDMQRSKGDRGRVHFFGNNHPWQSGGERHPPFEWWIQHFATLVQPLKDLGIEIVNCSRASALTCFRRASLGEIFAAGEVAA